VYLPISGGPAGETSGFGQRSNDGESLMDKPEVQDHRAGIPYPRYLVDHVSRLLIKQLQAEGCTVELTAPALGSVAVAITTADGKSHTEQGRPDDLEATIRAAARHCGVELGDL
jgi:hypothetical protein